MGRLLSEVYPRSFFILMLSSILFLFALQSMFPVLPLYAHAIGAGDAGWGLAFTVAAWTAVVFRLISGPLADRFGRKTVMFFGGISLVTGFLILWVTHGFVGLLAGRALQGAAVGAFTTAYKALIVDLAPEERRGEAVGLGNLTFGGALILAPPVGDALRLAYGYSPTFLFGAVFTLFCIFTLGFIHQAGYVPSHRSWSAGIRTIFPRQTTRIGTWGMWSVAATFASVVTFLALLADSRGIPGVGFAFSAYALMISVGQPLGGRLGDRLGRRQVIVPGLCLGSLGVLLLLLAGTQTALYVGAAIVGIGASITRVNLDTLVMNGAPRELRGTAAGLQYASADTWLGLLSMSLGFVAARFGYSAIYIVMMVIPLLLVPVMWFMIPPDLGRAVRQRASDITADR